jgi:hypothetical protein
MAGFDSPSQPIMESNMRGLAIATLFLGVCLVTPRADDDVARVALALVRGIIFLAAWGAIWFGV